MARAGTQGLRSHGRGSGTGAETARQFAAAGAWVAVVDRDAESAAAVAADIERKGGRALGVVADVAKADAVAAAAARTHKELGPCRVLVNNAAVRNREVLLDIDLEAWNRVLAVNLTGALVCTQAFAPQMIAAGNGGSIVHVASLLGHHPQIDSGAYSVSKAGLGMLSRVLALELPTASAATLSSGLHPHARERSVVSGPGNGGCARGRFSRTRGVACGSGGCDRLSRQRPRWLCHCAGHPRRRRRRQHLDGRRAAAAVRQHPRNPLTRSSNGVMLSYIRSVVRIYELGDSK